MFLVPFAGMSQAVADHRVASALTALASLQTSLMRFAHHMMRLCSRDLVLAIGFRGYSSSDGSGTRRC